MLQFFLFISFKLYSNERISNWIRAFTSPWSYSNQDIIKDYLEFYRLDFNNVAHFFSFLSNESYSVFVHEIYPSHADTTIIFFHGYLSHSGLFSDFYQYFLERGFGIVSVDLPGHGLSSGLRTGINDFLEYANVVKLVYDKVATNGKKVVLLGHSTGCAAIYEFIVHYNVYPKKVIFVAPLVRLILWELATTGYNLFGESVKELPRLKRKTTRNEKYIDFIFNRDPLGYEKVHLSWFKAAYIWNQRILKYPVITNVSLSIIQGTSDTVVDWKYNINFLTNKFPYVRVFLLKDVEHEILIEEEYIRNKCFQIIEQEIKDFRE